MIAQTQPTKEADIKRAWHVVDAKGKILGRLSTQIAQLLMGKSKPYFVRNLDCGDYVVVINAKEIKVTGKKETEKAYQRHSMYPGGFRSETFKELQKRRPEEVIVRGVKGMLPQNKLRASMLKRLKVSAGPEHEYAEKFVTKTVKA